jgi:prefoldin subunit 5
MVDMDEDRHAVSADGITVEKHVDTDRFKTPAVVLEITSAADRSATVTVTEPIPDAFAIEDIGFHPEFGGSNWSISGRNIVFERSIDPGEEYTTVYGVRDIGEDELATFVETGTSVTTDLDDGSEPASDAGAADAETGEDGAVKAGDDQAAETDDDGSIGADDDAAPEVGEEPIEELLEEDDGEAVREAIAGEGELLGDAGDDAAPEADDEPDTDAAESGDGEPPAEPATGADADGEDEAPEAEGEAAGYHTLPGSVAEALAAEIRDGTITEGNERVLRGAFADDQEASGSVDARIEHLQTQVADLAAYTDELERFLDEHGGGDSALAAVEEGLSEVTETVETLEEDLDAVAESTDELESNLTSLESGLEEAREEIGALDERFEEVDAFEERLEDAETGIDDLLYLEEDLMELQARTESLPDLEDDVSELQDRTEDLDDLEESVADLREERVADLDGRLDGLADAVDTLEAEMEEMKAFRDRLSSAFGPGGGPGEE